MEAVFQAASFVSFQSHVCLAYFRCDFFAHLEHVTRNFKHRSS